MYNKFFATACLLATAFCCRAQHIKDAAVDYEFITKPSTPLPPDIRHYHAELVAAFTDKDKKKMDEYAADQLRAKGEYDSAMIVYTKDLARAEKRYDTELAEYNKKSMGTKFLEKKVLEENNKPVKDLPYKPYPRTVEKPVLQTTYDLSLLADTYIHIDKLEKDPSNALKVIVTLYGYDYTQPHVMSSSEDILVVSTSGTGPSTRTSYYSEYSYRHPMAVKVLLPDGKEILSLTPQPLNMYKVAKSQLSAQMPSVNAELLVKTTEEKVLQDNLSYINKLLNQKFGYYRDKHTATLYYVKDNDGVYTDLTTAFNETSTALKSLADDSATAVPMLNDAVSLWNNALKESDFQTKKARIGEDETTVICFNLLEVFLALKKYPEGMAVMQKLNTINMSGKQRVIKNQFDQNYIALKKSLQ